MATAKKYNMAGQEIGTVQLPAVFGIEPNQAVLHEAVKNHLANMRQGTQSNLTRAEVRGGGKKPWRQKGTGRARTGSTRAPNWTHGGNAFANKPRTYRYSLNKKVKRLALLSALSLWAEQGKVIVVDDLNLPEVKTKQVVKFLSAIGQTGAKPLLVTPEVRENVVLSARNIPGTATTIATILSPYEILRHGALIVDETALSKIEEVYGV
ncbi:MAG: 50S ribosomal protein L4 [Oscillospiraceae bacterium]|jgi:large subunit ribosomal protein L4|nr:50S ribosomal protein L4 [Oscillospiraceae bacterium]